MSTFTQTTAARIFELLEKTGIPTAFITQLSETEMEKKNCKLIPLEVVARRYAVENFIRQKSEEDELPYRFHSLRIEFFSKPTDTIPFACEESKISLPENIEMKQIKDLARKSFLVLEGACNNLGYRLIDFKFEFGITDDGTLVVADVLDNGTWSLQTDAPFNIPEQTLVLWRGSESDKLPDVPILAGLKVEMPVISGHKKTVLVTKELERLHTLYPEGGVIIALVGMSNGLGPILSARTEWPLISVCTTANEFPEDVWSALRMPSNVPNATMLDAKNAVLCALNILGQKNPAIYAHRRLAIERLDEAV